MGFSDNRAAFLEWFSYLCHCCCKFIKFTKRALLSTKLDTRLYSQGTAETSLKHDMDSTELCYYNSLRVIYLCGSGVDWCCFRPVSDNLSTQPLFRCWPSVFSLSLTLLLLTRDYLPSEARNLVYTYPPASPSFLLKIPFQTQIFCCSIPLLPLFLVF